MLYMPEGSGICYIHQLKQTFFFFFYYLVHTFFLLSKVYAIAVRLLYRMICAMRRNIAVASDHSFYYPKPTCGDFFFSHPRTRYKGFACHWPYSSRRSQFNQATSDRVLHFQEHTRHSFVCLGTFKHDCELNPIISWTMCVSSGYTRINVTRFTY